MYNGKLRLYSIMPLDTEHMDEVCEDIRLQYETGVSNCPLFCMTLVPEGDPPADKVGKYCAKYALFKERLDKMGIPSGVLVQASIGHGWVLGEMFPFQQYTKLTDGETVSVVCPFDKDFHDHLRHMFSTIAAHKPSTVMVDDDFRLMERPFMGCACPLHMAEFNRLAGTSMTREELWEILRDPEHPLNAVYGPIFEKTQHDSIIEAAKMMREGIDSVDPTIPGSYCCVGNSVENAAEIAHILAGKGNPTVVRINNGHYSKPSPRDFARPFLRAGHQIAKLAGRVDCILAETDTCPQNRYSTGAMQLHTHFTGTIIEGARGAKHWITRLAAYEPKCGKAYRRVLAKNRGFYEALADIVPTLKWRGCRIPVSSEPLPFYSGLNDVSSEGWCRCVLEALGIPFYYSAENGGALCLDGRADAIISDEKMKEALSGTVLIASDSAERLIKRGFGEYLGVDVREWSGKALNGERIFANSNRVAAQMKSKELVERDESVIVDSMVYNTLDNEVYTDLFPGSTIYRNALGGTVCVFCGTPMANHTITEAYSYLNYSRKKQLVKILRDTGELPLYAPGDEPLYVRAADMQDGGLFAAVFNLSIDPIERTELVVCDREVTRIERLMPDGTRVPVGFTKSGEVLSVECPCDPLDPAVLLVY